MARITDKQLNHRLECINDLLPDKYHLNIAGRNDYNYIELYRGGKTIGVFKTVSMMYEAMGALYDVLYEVKKGEQ